MGCHGISSLTDMRKNLQEKKGRGRGTGVLGPQACVRARERARIAFVICSTPSPSLFMYVSNFIDMQSNYRNYF